VAGAWGHRTLRDGGRVAEVVECRQLWRGVIGRRGVVARVPGCRGATGSGEARSCCTAMTASKPWRWVARGGTRLVTV
jgi:hypothetical protein